MYYFFLIIDYLIPILMIISYPYWKKIANGDINKSSGFRTYNSMKSQENWKKANLLCGKYTLIGGIILLIFVTIMRIIKLFEMQWNSLLITTICIIYYLVIIIVVNNKIK